MRPMTWIRAASRWTPRGNHGLTILEILAAIAILAFGLLAVATMQASSIKGNSQAIDTTEAMTLAQDKVEELMRLPYDDPDDSHDPLDDDSGSAGTAGLNDTVDGGGTVIADGSELAVYNRYDIYWNVAEDQPVNNVKTVRVIVVWTYKGRQKTGTVEFMKSEIL